MTYNWTDQHSGIAVPASGSVSEAHIVNKYKNIKEK